MTDPDECGCHRECVTTPHECEKPCTWPLCMSEEEQQKLAQEIADDLW